MQNFLKGKRALSKGDTGAAKEMLAAVVQQAAEQFGTQDNRYVDSSLWVALVLSKREEFAEAEFVLREILAMDIANSQRIAILQCLANLFEMQQRYKQVEEVHRQLIDLYQQEGHSLSVAEMMISRVKSWEALLAERDSGAGTLVNDLPAVKKPE
jgi:hypothetical protein